MQPPPTPVISPLPAKVPLSPFLRLREREAGDAPCSTMSLQIGMIVLDQQDATAADAGDLSIACQGATLAVPPVAGAGGRRRALLYDVTSDRNDRPRSAGCNRRRRR